MRLLTQTQYAQHRSVARPTIAQAIRDGRITPVIDAKGRKWIDPETADDEWEKNTDHLQAIRGNGHKRKAAAEAQPKLKQASTAKVGDNPYWNAKVRREQAAAQMAELDVAKRAGELVEVARVRMASMSMARMLRDSILAIPAKLGLEPEVERRISEALRKGLDDIARLTASDLERIAE